MSEDLNNNEATQPVQANPSRTEPVAPEFTQPNPTAEIPTSPLKGSPESNSSQPDNKPSKPKRKGRGLLILAGIVLILAGAAIGSYGGYQSGMQSRMDLQSSQVAMTAATQFQLGLNDLNGERYDLARTRFEYVIKLDPNFPGVQQKLAQTLVEMSRTEVPTATATVTLTPTPDMRGEQDLFDQIQQNMVDKKWDAAISASETLRTKNLTYRTVDVDGMYYIALRYRGVDRILRLGDLEGGMYDLALVQRFGPLDRDADSYRLFARYYAVGASFWEVDWEKSVYYFGQVVPFLPMLRDASGIGAIDRYRQASISYAAQLINADDFCKAEKILSEALANNYKNATAEPLATRAFNECHPATETPQPTQAASVTPTITMTRLTLAATTQAAKTATPTPTAATTATIAPTAGPTVAATTPPTGATATVPAPSNTPVPLKSTNNP